jgi:hypothetical protein
VSKALHFKHEVPVTVRFSANSGIPKIVDADPRAAPRGLAIRFRLPDGSDTDLVTHSYNGFPAKNPEEFQQFFLAIAGSKPGVPSPTPIEAFQETHERKFLVANNDWRQSAVRSVSIRDGLIAIYKDRKVRVRIIGDCRYGNASRSSLNARTWRGPTVASFACRTPR